MNADPRYASYWRGRVMLRLTTEITKKPKTKVVKIKEEGFDELIRSKFETGPEYEIRC